MPWCSVGAWGREVGQGDGDESRLVVRVGPQMSPLDIQNVGQ